MYCRDLSLDDLRSLGLGNAEVLKKADQIQAVAVKEAGVQQALKRMQQELQERELTVLRYKDKEGAYKLGSMEEVQTALDEQVMTVQTIVASPFSSSFKPEARRWEHHLLVLQDLLDTWMKVQVRWLYLEPIFQSQDIMAQLPETTTQFLSVDTTFQVIMHSTHDDPCAPFRLENTIVNQERLEQLHRSLGHLEEVHKALSSYLDAKRLLFPRFFFLSDDEMLEILSKVRDPTRVEPHLRKSFEGIAKLNFEGKARDPAITGMASAEGERIPFVTTVYPRESGGNVEKWLLKVRALTEGWVWVQDVEVRIFVRLFRYRVKGLVCDPLNGWRPDQECPEDTVRRILSTQGQDPPRSLPVAYERQSASFAGGALDVRGDQGDHQPGHGRLQGRTQR